MGTEAHVHEDQDVTHSGGPCAVTAQDIAWSPLQGRVRRAGAAAERRFLDACQAKGWPRYPEGYEPVFEHRPGAGGGAAQPAPAVNAAALFLAEPFDEDAASQLLLQPMGAVRVRASSFFADSNEWAPMPWSTSSSSSSGLPSLGDPPLSSPRLTASSNSSMPELEPESQDELEVAAQQLPRSFGLLDMEDDGLPVGAATKEVSLTPSSPASGSARSARDPAAEGSAPAAAGHEAATNQAAEGDTSAAAMAPAAAEQEAAGASTPVAAERS